MSSELSQKIVDSFTFLISFNCNHNQLSGKVSLGNIGTYFSDLEPALWWKRMASLSLRTNICLQTWRKGAKIFTALQPNIYSSATKYLSLYWTWSCEIVCQWYRQRWVRPWSPAEVARWPRPSTGRCPPDSRTSRSSLSQSCSPSPPPNPPTSSSHSVRTTLATWDRMLLYDAEKIYDTSYILHFLVKFTAWMFFRHLL